MEWARKIPTYSPPHNKKKWWRRDKRDGHAPEKVGFLYCVRLSLSLIVFIIMTIIIIKKEEEEKLGKREILYDVSYRRWQSARAGTNWWVNFRIDDTAVASLFLFLTKNQQFTEQEPCSWFIVLELRALKKKKPNKRRKNQITIPVTSTCFLSVYNWSAHYNRFPTFPTGQQHVSRQSLYVWCYWFIPRRIALRWEVKLQDLKSLWALPL